MTFFPWRKRTRWDLMDEYLRLLQENHRLRRDLAVAQGMTPKEAVRAAMLKDKQNLDLLRP